MLFWPIFGNFWCPGVTLVTFSSNVSNFERNPEKQKIHKKSKTLKINSKILKKNQNNLKKNQKINNKSQQSEKNVKNSQKVPKYHKVSKNLKTNIFFV